MGKSDVHPDKRLSSHVLATEDALGGLLGTPSKDGKSDEQLESIRALFESQIKNDPVAEAAFERTDGFIPAEEYAERLRLRRER